MDVLVIVLVVGLLSNVTDGGGFPKNNIKLNYIITVYLISAALKAFVSIARRNTKTNSGRALLLDFFLTSSSLSSFYSNTTIREEHTNLFFFVRNGAAKCLSFSFFSSKKKSVTSPLPLSSVLPKVFEHDVQPRTRRRRRRRNGRRSRHKSEHDDDEHYEQRWGKYWRSLARFSFHSSTTSGGDAFSRSIFLLLGRTLTRFSSRQQQRRSSP